MFLIRLRTPYWMSRLPDTDAGGGQLPQHTLHRQWIKFFPIGISFPVGLLIGEKVGHDDVHFLAFGSHDYYHPILLSLMSTFVVTFVYASSSLESCFLVIEI